MNVPRFAVAVLLPVFAASASAATFDLGTGSFSQMVEKNDTREFTDVYNFSTAPGTGSVVGSLTEIRPFNRIDLDWGDVAAITVYGGADAAGPQLFQFSGPYVPTLALNFNLGAVPSLFSVVVRGRAIGFEGGDEVPPLLGAYRLDLVAQPVPEPATLALLLAGLGVLGVTARRCRRAD